jgi:hypothetical protein
VGKVTVDINWPEEEDAAAARLRASRDLMDQSRQVQRGVTRMRADYPEAEFWVVETTYPDNTFDLVDGTGAMQHVPCPSDPKAYKYLKPDMTVVVRYRRVNRQSPYISGVGMHTALSVVLPSYWPRSHQSAGRINYPLALSPANLLATETWDCADSLTALRADALGVWAATFTEGLQRILTGTAWTLGDPYAPGEFMSSPLGITDFSLLADGRLWLQMAAQVGPDLYRLLRLTAPPDDAWTVSWKLDGVDPLRGYGLPYGDPIEHDGVLYQMAILTDEGDGSIGLVSHSILLTDGSILGTRKLPFTEDIATRLADSYGPEADTLEGAVNPSLGGCLRPLEASGRVTRSGSIVGPTATPWTLDIHGHLTVIADEKAICLPQTLCNQFRAYNLGADGNPGEAAQLWEQAPITIPDNPTAEPVEFHYYLPIAAVEKYKSVPAQFVFAWEKRTYLSRPAWNKPSASALSTVNVWIGVHAMMSVSYWAPNAYAWTDQDSWDAVTADLSTIRLKLPFDPDIAPDFQFYNDVRLADDPFAAAEDFLQNGADPGTPVSPIDVVRTATVGFTDCTYTPGADGVGSTLAANDPGNVLLEIGGTWIESGTILLTGQADPIQNGVFDITNNGGETLGVSWILTRATVADEAAEVNGQWVHDTHTGKYWLCDLAVTTVDDDPVIYRLALDEEGIEPLMEVIHPGTDVDAHNIWTKASYGLQTRNALTGAVIATRDLNETIFPTPRYSGSLTGKVGTPTLSTRTTFKAAGDVVAMADIRVDVPDGKTAGTSVVIAIVKHPIFADDLNQPIPDTDPVEYVPWAGVAYAWIFWHVEGINTGPAGLVPEDYEATYYAYAWLYDAQTWDVEDCQPPNFDLTMCAVDTDSKTILFGPGNRIDGVIGTNPDGSLQVLYGPHVSGPETTRGALTFPLPVGGYAAGFALDTLAKKWITQVGTTVGHGIESARSEWLGANPIICPTKLKAGSPRVGLVVAHGYGTEGHQHGSCAALLDLETGEILNNDEDDEAGSGSTTGAENATLVTGAIYSAGSLFYVQGDAPEILRRRGS